MAKTKLLGNDRKEQLNQQQKAAKKANRKKRKTPLRVIKDVISELKKVTWPTAKTLIKYAGAVIAFIIVMAAFTYLVDFGLTNLFGLITK
jgi:preprotein translocase subunit SecE